MPKYHRLDLSVTRNSSEKSSLNFRLKADTHLIAGDSTTSCRAILNTGKLNVGTDGMLGTNLRGQVFGLVTTDGSGGDMSAKKVFVGLLVGAAVGAVIGVMLAPDKGSRTRSLLKRKGAELAEAATEKVNTVVEDLTATSGRLKEGVSNVAKKSKNALDALQS